MKKHFKSDDIRRRYEKMTSSAIAECELTSVLVGGVSADEDGIRSWVRHHLKLEGAEADSAVKRIMKEEIGERPVPSEEGELEERLTYGLNVIRRDDFGPWLGNWMVKACLKAAASRLGLFAKKKGSKGDLAEMGEVQAYGPSYVKTSDYDEYLAHEKIHLISPDGDATETIYTKFKGRVQTAKGSASIINDCECAPPGTRFSFEFRYFPGKITENDLLDIFSAATVIGLGSCKAFERGKFKINDLVFEAGTGKKGEEKVEELVEA